VASGYDPGQPDIPYLKPAPLKNASRPVLRQFKDGPVAVTGSDDGRVASPDLNQRIFFFNSALMFAQYRSSPFSSGCTVGSSASL